MSLPRNSEERETIAVLPRRLRALVSNMIVNEFRCHRIKADEMANWLLEKMRAEQ